MLHQSGLAYGFKVCKGVLFKLTLTPLLLLQDPLYRDAVGGCPHQEISPKLDDYVSSATQVRPM